MDKKVRIRSKDNAQFMLLKMLPLLFMILMFLVSTTVGAGSNGPLGSVID